LLCLTKTNIFNVDLPQKLFYYKSNGGKQTMIYDIISLKNKYGSYSNIYQKIGLVVKSGVLVKIKRGLYSDDIENDYQVIANLIYSPSYLSFEYALSFYGLIPERVDVLTSVCFGKKNNKFYRTSNKVFEYRSVPNDAYPYGVTSLVSGSGISYRIASKEKALCDTLYSKYPVRSIGDMQILLFDDLRVDEEEFLKLDFSLLKELARKYQSNTLNMLVKFLNKEERR
jgi:predicted transcriptional regulator of viral defense system